MNLHAKVTCFALTAVLTGALLSLAGAVDTATKPAQDWPLFRGNALQTGVAGSELPERLAVRWKFETKEGIEGAAAIVRGRVYIGSLDEHFYALDLATGAEKWKYKAGPFKVAPAVKDGAVYVGDLDGMFHCFDAATGEKRWKYEAGGEISSGANFAGDAVLFGSGDETLYCLTAKDGKELWKFKVQGGPVLGTPAVAGDRTFVAGCDSNLHVLDTTKGKEITGVDLGGQTACAGAVFGDQLYVGTMNNEFLAVDWMKGQITWRYEPKRHAQPFYASAAVTDTLVVTGCRDKRVYALNRKTGEEVWSVATGGRVDSSPVIVGKRVYVGSLDKHLYVLDLAKGTELQKIELDGAISASPAVGEGCLVIGTDKGTVYCLGEKK